MNIRWCLMVCAAVTFLAISAGTSTGQGIYHWDRTSQSSEARSDCSAWVVNGPDNSSTDTSTSPSSDSVSSDTTVASSGDGYSAAEAEGVCTLNTDGQAILRWDFSHDITAQINANEEADVSVATQQKTETETYATLDHPNPPPGDTTARLVVNIQWSANTCANFTTRRDMDIDIEMGDAYLHLYVDENALLVADGIDGNGNPFYKASTTCVTSDSGSLQIGPSEFTEPVDVDDEASIECSDPVLSSFECLYWGPVWSGTKTGTFSGSIEIRVDN